MPIPSRNNATDTPTHTGFRVRRRKVSSSGSVQTFLLTPSRSLITAITAMQNPTSAGPKRSSLEGQASPELPS
ncbi:hypothetical protein RBB77_04885 [Tunturibacter psychrotolerans]|uniref:Uncharacterized protein n=1 Tax=Tunturiibacter psychrotolerans TaxID=3069686 RepID=A0AAU7ZTE0_9BACT